MVATGGLSLIMVGFFLFLPSVTSLIDIERFNGQLISSLTQLALNNQEFERQGHLSRTIQFALQEAVISVDEQLRVQFWNHGAERIFGWEREEVTDRSLLTILPPDQHEMVRSWIQQVNTTGESSLFGRTLEVATFNRENRRILLDASVSSWTSKGVRHYVGVLRDVTLRKEREAEKERLHQSRLAISSVLKLSLEAVPLHQQLQEALEIILATPWLTILAKGAIFLYDEEHNQLVMVAQKGLSPTLHTACAKLAMGHCLCGIAAESRTLQYRAGLDEDHHVTYPTITPHGHYCIPILFQDKLLGVINTYLDHGHPKDEEEVAFLQAIANTLAGLIQRKQMEEELLRLAWTDPLTSLPNRKGLFEHMKHHLARSRREKTILGVLFLDLDGFKAVNDHHGHEVGDQLLMMAARRLRQQIRASDIVARLGGDEFVVILTWLAHGEDASVVADKIIQTLNQPFLIGEHTLGIGVSIGGALYPAHAFDSEELLKRADEAMYQVKKAGKNNFRLLATS
ncbi:MAG: diguanylate cyclase [Magnetococcales bacterium]|nr:diguanylate cyclase [Magnetococcales bacterium]